MSDQPLFRQTEPGVFMPDLLARGPFDGLQGGAVAALMCSAIEAEAPGRVASVTTHFLRPAPVAPLTLSVRTLRAGRRVSVIDAEVTGAAGTIAVQRATVIAEAPQPWPAPPPRPVDPAVAELRLRTAPHGGPWLMDTMEVREAKGVFWFRQRRPVVAGAGPMAAVLPAADWAHGLTAPLGCAQAQRPPAAIPNPDVTAHLFRPARGPWIGVEPATAWSDVSIGAGWAALYDAEGLIGRVAMSVAVAAVT